jgi:hypothetical protein
MQQALKFASRAAGAKIVAAEFFGQLNIAVNEPSSTLDVRFRGE